MDVIWAFLSCVKNIDSSLRFKMLTDVARLVFSHPSCDAGEESFFSLIKQNRTPNRSSLDVNGTLPSMIQINRISTIHYSIACTRVTVNFLIDVVLYAR